MITDPFVYDDHVDDSFLISDHFIRSSAFLSSYQWRCVRYAVLVAANGRCSACGRTAHDDIILNVDHIKPRAKYPDLALDTNNLQILCNECNHGKGNIDETDWRTKRETKRDLKTIIKIREVAKSDLKIAIRGCADRYRKTGTVPDWLMKRVVEAHQFLIVLTNAVNDLKQDDEKKKETAGQ